MHKHTHLHRGVGRAQLVCMDIYMNVVVDFLLQNVKYDYQEMQRQNHFLRSTYQQAKIPKEIAILYGCRSPKKKSI